MSSELVSCFMIGVNGCAIAAGFLFTGTGVVVVLCSVFSLIGGIFKLFGHGSEKGEKKNGR